MNDHQIAIRIAYCMAASAVAAVFIIVAMVTGTREWAAVALLSALTSLAAVGSVLLNLRKGRP